MNLYLMILIHHLINFKSNLNICLEYESAAEARMLKLAGADTVGRS